MVASRHMLLCPSTIVCCVNSGKEKAIRYGAVDAAAEKLTDDDAQVRAMAAGAIQTMCVNQEAKPLFLEVRTGVRVRGIAMQRWGSTALHSDGVC